MALVMPPPAASGYDLDALRDSDVDRLKDFKSIVYNGHVYKSLADHDPHSTTAISEYEKLFNLDPAWELCPNTPDALRVCRTYPWAADALVLKDGSAHWTKLASSKKSWLSMNQPEMFLPGTCAASSGCLRSEEGYKEGYKVQYGVRQGFREGFLLSLLDFVGFLRLDVLIRRKL